MLENSHLNNYNICECDNDSFSINTYYCYKCDNKYLDPGCDASKGCSYFNNNDQFNCNQYKKGYFRYSDQCYSCSDEIENCEEWHYDNDPIPRKFCDKCKDGYTYDSKSKKC